MGMDNSKKNNQHNQSSYERTKTEAASIGLSGPATGIHYGFQSSVFMEFLSMDTRWSLISVSCGAGELFFFSWFALSNSYVLDRL